MKNIVLIAPPAAGKGTQSKKLSSHYHVPHISIGDLLRETPEDTEEGKKIREQMRKGLLVDDKTIASLLSKRIQKEDCCNGYVLDGFPRNFSQAVLYDTMLEKLDKKVESVLFLNLDYQTSQKRIIGRVSCPVCGHVFNTEIEALKPKVDGICDICHQGLTKREDDTAETFAKRFETYQRETEPLVNYYKDKKILYTIDGTQTADEIFKDILQILEEGAS